MTDPLLALWQTQPAPEAVAFGPAAAPPPPQAVVWRLELPADERAARAQLDAIDAAIRQAEQANDRAPDCLQALVASQQAPAAFAAAPTPPPERELLALIQPPPEAVSFAWGLPGDWEQVADELRDFLESVRRFVAHYAWVETTVGGDLVARTQVSWSGNFETAWEQPLPPGAEALHHRSLQLALASRTALLRTTAVILSGALLILPLVTNPAGVVVALPAVWRFIQRLREELERNQDEVAAETVAG